MFNAYLAKPVKDAQGNITGWEPKGRFSGTAVPPAGCQIFYSRDDFRYFKIELNQDGQYEVVEDTPSKQAADLAKSQAVQRRSQVLQMLDTFNASELSDPGKMRVIVERLVDAVKLLIK